MMLVSHCNRDQETAASLATEYDRPLQDTNTAPPDNSSLFINSSEKIKWQEYLTFFGRTLLLKFDAKHAMIE